MRFRFIGQYTNGHTSIDAWNIVFHGREYADVPEALVEKFARHPEFEPIDPLDHDGDGEKGGSLPDAVAPRRRGRKPKAAQ